MSKQMERYARQTGKKYKGEKGTDDIIDKFIDSRMIVRKFISEYLRLKEEEKKKKQQEEELIEKLEKEYEEKIKKDVINAIKDAMKP